MGRVWGELKDEGKSRCDKRKTPEDLEVRRSSPVKFRKMEEGSNLGPNIVNLPTKTKNFLHRKKAAPARALTPDIFSKSKQAKMTEWLEESKIGGKLDRTLPKKNPYPLSLPSGPKPTPRTLFSMKDDKEDFLKTLASKEALKKEILPTTSDPKPPAAARRVPSSSQSSLSSPKPPAKKPEDSKKSKHQPATIPKVPASQEKKMSAPTASPGLSHPDLPAEKSSLMPPPPPPRGRATPKKSKKPSPSPILVKTIATPEEPKQQPAGNPALSQLMSPARDPVDMFGSMKEKESSPQPKLGGKSLNKKTQIKKIDRSKFHS